MSIKKIKTPKTRGINVSGEREELLKINEIIDQVNTNTDNISSISPNYLVYKALLTQAGTNAPTVTILTDTLNTTPVFSYVAPGVYDMVSADFVEDKTFVFMYGLSNVDTTHTIYRVDVDKLRIATNFGGVPDNGILDKTSILIEIYP